MFIECVVILIIPMVGFFVSLGAILFGFYFFYEGRSSFFSSFVVMLFSFLIFLGHLYLSSRILKKMNESEAYQKVTEILGLYPESFIDCGIPEYALLLFFVFMIVEGRTRNKKRWG